ncbi:MAG: DUF359 domain-containing protein [archaeon]
MRFELSESEIPKFRQPLSKVMTYEEAERQLKADLVVAVGDRVSWQFSQSKKRRPDVFIVDGVEQRKKVRLNFRTRKKIRARNAPATVSEELWEAVKASLKEKDVKIVVRGEEDLAVMPVVMLAPEGAQVVYGQPKEGVVLLTVTEELKERVASLFIDYYIKRGKEFFERIQKKDKVFVVHHTDADGCTSGALVLKKLEEIGVTKVEAASPQNSPVIEKGIRDRIKEFAPDARIVVDMGNENTKYLRKLSRRIKVCVIDHHKLFSPDFGRTVLVNPHLAKAPLSMNPSAAYFVQKCTQGPAWLSVVGSIGDKGLGKIRDMERQVREADNITISELEECGILVNSAEAYENGGAQIALKALLECKKPKDLLYGYRENTVKLRKMKEMVHGCVLDIIKNHKKSAKFYNDVKLVALEVGTQYSIKSNVADFLQDKHPKWVVMIYRKENGRVNLSVRTHTKVDLASALKVALKGIGKGGGHAPAAGGMVKAKDFDKFMERFKAEVGRRQKLLIRG